MKRSGDDKTIRSVQGDTVVSERLADSRIFDWFSPHSNRGGNARITGQSGNRSISLASVPCESLASLKSGTSGP